MPEDGTDCGVRAAQLQRTKSVASRGDMPVERMQELANALSNLDEEAMQGMVLALVVLQGRCSDPACSVGSPVLLLWLLWEEGKAHM